MEIVGGTSRRLNKERKLDLASDIRRIVAESESPLPKASAIGQALEDAGIDEDAVETIEQIMLSVKFYTSYAGGGRPTVID